MDGFKKSLPILFGLLILSAAPTPLGSNGQGPPQRPRNFYLTKTEHNGAQALSACAAGYHMASLWEIFDPSNLRYDTDLGFKSDDSGFGPPDNYGWIRTGHSAATFTIPGVGNCNAWTSSDGGGSGSLAGLQPGWNHDGSITSPWTGDEVACSATVPVWCVQD
jgi:hypothetical protein